VRSLATLVLILASGAAARADVETTATIDVLIGAVPYGAIRGFVAPALHLDAGAGGPRWRVHAILDQGLWTEDDLPSSATGVAPSATFGRLGVGLRYTVLDLPFGRPYERGPNALRIYVEADGGRETLAGATTFARADVGIGLGLAQAARLGDTIFGGHVGIRALVAAPPDDTIAGRVVACRGPCPSPSASHHADVALFLLLGVVVGR
jgi:hypothetical protein